MVVIYLKKILIMRIAVKKRKILAEIPMAKDRVVQMVREVQTDRMVQMVRAVHMENVLNLHHQSLSQSKSLHYSAFKQKKIVKSTTICD